MWKNKGRKIEEYWFGKENCERKRTLSFFFLLLRRIKAEYLKEYQIKNVIFLFLPVIQNNVGTWKEKGKQERKKELFLLLPLIQRNRRILDEKRKCKMMVKDVSFLSSFYLEEWKNVGSKRKSENEDKRNIPSPSSYLEAWKNVK